MIPYLQSVLVLFCFIGGLVLSGLIRLIPDFLPDVPNHRSSHTKTVPRGGGLSFIIPFCVAMGVLMYRSGVSDLGLLSLVLGSLLIGLIGLADDAIALPITPRLFFQILFTIGFCFWGAPAKFELPGLIQITGWPAHIIQVVWVLCCINFFNFMDGIDAIAGSQAVFIAVVSGIFLYLDYSDFDQLYRSNTNLVPLLVQANTYQILATSLFCLAAALLGFLCWNMPPARLFMGDTGSYFLGFLFAYIAIIFPAATETSLLKPSILLGPKTSVPIFSFMVPFTLLLPFILDGAQTILRRFHAGENILQAHRDHLYQLLFRSGRSAWKVDLIYLGFSTLALLPLTLLYFTRNQLYASLGGILIILVLGPLMLIWSLYLQKQLNLEQS